MASQRPTLTTVAHRVAGSSESWHNKITPEGPFQPARDRYRLYIGHFCPFAQRANIVRHLKGLQDIIPVTVVKPFPKGDDAGWPGWRFPTTADEYPGADPDPLFGASFLHELYFKVDPEYKGRYTVPVLWDAEQNTIVNNESAELLRDLQTAFDGLLPPAQAALTLYPPRLRAEIDAVAEWLQWGLNSGVYRAGFATTQEDYERGVVVVFATLNRLERLIAARGGPFVLGAELTELDVRAYATVVRFDAIYVQHFKCNLGTVRHDYPVIHAWLKGLYWSGTWPAFRDTTDFRHIKDNYTKSHAGINPRGITPLGPWPEVEPADRTGDGIGGLVPGGVKMPLVLEAEAALEEKFGKFIPC